MSFNWRDEDDWMAVVVGAFFVCVATAISVACICFSWWLLRLTFFQVG